VYSIPDIMPDRHPADQRPRYVHPEVVNTALLEVSLCELRVFIGVRQKEEQGRRASEERRDSLLITGLREKRLKVVKMA